MNVIEFPSSGSDRTLSSTEDPDLLVHYLVHCRRTLEDLAFTKARLNTFLDGPEYHAVYHLIEVIQKRVEAIVVVDRMTEADIPAIFRCLEECRSDLIHVDSMIRRTAP